MDISNGIQNLILQVQSTLTLVQVIVVLVAIIACISLALIITAYSHIRKCEDILTEYIKDEYEK